LALGSAALAAAPGEKRVRTAYLDRRGSGRSERPKDRKFHSLALLKPDVETIQKALGAEKIVLLAHSAGTPIAFAWSTRSLTPRPVSARAPPCANATRSRAFPSEQREAFFDDNMFPDPLACGHLLFSELLGYARNDANGGI